MRSTGSWRCLGILAVCWLASSPGPADAMDVRFDIGLRLEVLSLDGDLNFSCTCDPEENPGCQTDPDYCNEALIEDPHEGVLLGALVGANFHHRWWAAGIRLAAAAGPFEPTDEKARQAEDSSVLLAHVTFEIPVEAHVVMPGVEVFAQIAPRFGFLNYSEGGRREDPDTLTAGVLLTTGVRFGGSWTIGAATGKVLHPHFDGYLVEATYRRPAAKSELPKPEGAPPPEDTPEAPVEEPPVEQPPAEEPPAEQPAEEPPAEEPAPIETPAKTSEAT